MNKGLRALKEARNFRHEKDKNLVVIDIDYFNQCLDIIETTLKALEIIKGNLYIDFDDKSKTISLKVYKEQYCDYSVIFCET